VVVSFAAQVRGFGRDYLSVAAEWPFMRVHKKSFCQMIVLLHNHSTEWFLTIHMQTISFSPYRIHDRCG
jgi:hypothetical protein